MRRLLLRDKLLILFLCVVVAAAIFRPWQYPPIGTALLVLAGNAPDCTAWDASRACYRRMLHTEYQAELLATSRTARAEGRYQLIETADGSFWEPRGPHGSVVISQLAEIRSKYSLGADGPFKPGAVILDIGANVGVFSRKALESGASLVVAIEPDPDNLECLRRNLQAFQGRAVIIPKGAWDSNGTLVLHQSTHSAANHSFVAHSDTAPGPSLPVVTVDSVVSGLSLKRLDFIKIDVDGSEGRIISGATATISRFRPKVEAEISGNQAALNALLNQSGVRYRPECLVCVASMSTKAIGPSLSMFVAQD
jgi:FkbM family methyltransferase